MASRDTVDDLRSLLSSRGLPPRARKADLLKRCRVHRMALQRAPGVTAEKGASRVPPPVGARGVSGGGASGGGEVLTVHTPSQSLSVTRGTTEGPDASLQASIPPDSGALRVGGAGAAAAVAVPTAEPRGADRAPAFSKNKSAAGTHFVHTRRGGGSSHVARRYVPPTARRLSVPWSYLGGCCGAGFQRVGPVRCAGRMC